MSASSVDELDLGFPDISPAGKWSDAQNAEHISLDESDGLVVVHSGTRQHKTATTADKRTTLLPLVCLGSGLESAPLIKIGMNIVDTCSQPTASSQAHGLEGV